MTTKRISKKTKEEFGYSSQEELLMFKYNPNIPSGSFSIQNRDGKWYWYYQLSIKRLGDKTRVKYICPTFEGVNSDGLNSFQVCFGKLVEKVNSDFIKTQNNNTRLSTLIDDYNRTLIIEENDPKGIRKKETTLSMRNGINRFREYCLTEDIRLSDVIDGRKIREQVKEYVEYCKNKITPSGKKGLSRNTIRTYLKQIKYFMDWLEDDVVGRGIISINPINLDVIKKIYPYNPNERQGYTKRNFYYSRDGYDEMYDRCVERVGELWRDFCENGWSRKQKNQSLGVGCDVVYFISLFQLYSGFRIGEILTSFRNIDYWNDRLDKKNSSSYWNKIDGVWYLMIDWKNKESSVPITLKIRSWVKPRGIEIEPTKDKNGKTLYWDTNLVDVCMVMFRDSPFLFSSPNTRSHKLGHYSKTYIMNLVKQMLVNKGVGGDGWIEHGINSSHDFRDYFITHKLGSGTPIQEVSRITRNSIQTIEKFYLRLDTETQLRIQTDLDKTRIIKTKKEREEIRRRKDKD